MRLLIAGGVNPLITTVVPSATSFNYLDDSAYTYLPALLVDFDGFRGGYAAGLHHVFAVALTLWTCWSGL